VTAGVLAPHGGGRHISTSSSFTPRITYPGFHSGSATSRSAGARRSNSPNDALSSSRPSAAAQAVVDPRAERQMGIVGAG